MCEWNAVQGYTALMLDNDTRNVLWTSKKVENCNIIAASKSVCIYKLFPYISSFFWGEIPHFEYNRMNVFILLDIFIRIKTRWLYNSSVE